jgi:nucleoside-diphosphate-sugar epimerase
MDETHVVVGAGPLGRAVASALAERGRTVRLVNRSDPGDVPPGATVRVADVADADAAVDACAGAAVVYDCVGMPYPEWAEGLPAVTRGVLAGAAAADARVVAADNLYAYGPVDGPLTEDLPAGATDAKGRVRAERARTYLDDDRVPVAVGRASDFFGPGVVDTAPTADPFGAALRGDRLWVLGDPDQPHSFSFVPDFASALVTLGAHDRAFGEVWHVPHAPAVTTREFLERVFEAAGTEPRVRSAPRVLEALLGVVNPQVRELRAIRHQFEAPFVVDHAKFADAFGASPTPLDEAIARTLDWHRTRDR